MTFRTEEISLWGRSIATHFIPENHHWFTLPFSFSLFFSPSSYSSCYSSPYSVISPPSSLSIQAHLPHTKETVIIPPKRSISSLLILFMSLHTLFLSPCLYRSSSPPHTYRQDPFTGTPQTGSLKIIINIDPERERE